MRGFNGDFDLFERGASDNVIGFFAAEQNIAAGVCKGEGAAVLFGPSGNAIGADAGAIVNDGDDSGHRVKPFVPGFQPLEVGAFFTHFQ